jgi:site-specific DNA-cytosine methylase
MPDGIGLATELRTYRHGHLFCGLGGGAKGFNNATARVGNMVARFECVGGIDVDAGAIRDFERLTGVRGTVMDLFDREQYIAFHGHEPPRDWKEAVPDDILRAFNYQIPNILFLSAPCKGFSGLLSETRSKTDKYQALNRLTLRGVYLALEAFRADPPELIIFENVPRIATRGRRLLDQIVGMLRSFGYATAETKHDCGEIGGLSQSRKRFLLVARFQAKVPNFLYEPPRRPLRGVGEVLGRMPLPGDERAGPMHRIPALQWQTWVRLAFVEAGSDWRSLNKLAIEDGFLRDYLIVPEMRSGVLGVNRWDEPSCTVAGRSSPSNNAYSVADPRFAASSRWKDGQQYGVTDWDQASHTIAGQQSPGQGRYAVADPRHYGTAKHSNEYRIAPWSDAAGSVTGAHGTGQCVADPRPSNNRQFENIYRITRWDQHARTVIGRAQPSDGGLCVADPRASSAYEGGGKYPVTGWDKPTGTVIASSTTGHGSFAVADPRTELRGGGMGVRAWDQSANTVAGESLPSNGAFAVADPRWQKGDPDTYRTGGQYGVMPWDEPSGAVSAAACHDNGRWSVADPRLPDKTDRLVCVIRSLDGTWHRPFTTLELAALQSLVDPGEMFTLAGESDQDWRERIGNAVPSDAAQAIAETMGRTLLLAATGERFALSAVPIWVRPVAVALSVAQPGDMPQ